MTQTAQVGKPAHTRREDAVGTPPLRPTLVPVERYLSVEFAQLETQRMWPKVWQVACTVDHVAEAGDYFEYRCGPYSILIVRGDDGTLRAFQNVCRHRGNSLCTSSGADLRELRCGYHGWTWDLSLTKAFATERGVDLSWASTDQMMRLHQYNVFPNMTLLTNADHLTVMTSHPGPDPDHGELVMMLWMRMPPGAPRSKPVDVRMTADEAHPGLVLTQDITVLPGLQRGMRQPGFTHVVLSNEERRVINMHRNLERYLDLPEPDRMTGGEPVDASAQQQ